MEIISKYTDYALTHTHTHLHTCTEVPPAVQEENYKLFLSLHIGSSLISSVFNVLLIREELVMAEVFVQFVSEITETSEDASAQRWGSGGSWGSRGTF